MRTRLRVLGAAVATAAAAVAVPLVTSSDAHAARFAGGDVVVYTVGDGVTALSNAGAKVSLGEYTPSGSLVQSVSLPTAAADGNHRLVAAGESRSEGLISRSADGRFLVVTGYDAATGATGPSGTSLANSDPSSVGRIVGLVDSNGTVDTSTELTGSSTPQIVRSATTTDGERLWVAGGNGGVLTTTRGSGAASTVAGTGSSNLSSLTVQGGQLFASGILTNRLSTVGTGTPTTGSLTDLTGLPSNLLTYGYAFVDATGQGFDGTNLDTLYIADASSRGGTLDKYRYDGSTWVADGFVDVPGISGVVAAEDGASVTLEATTPTSLVSVIDPDGSSSTASEFSGVTPSVVATAEAKTEFRGLALAPTPATGPSVYIRTPGVGESIPVGGHASVSALVDTPSPRTIASVQVKIGSGSFVDATVGSGHVWTASVPTTGLAAGGSSVTVKATDSASATTTVSRHVTLTGTSNVLAGGTYPWTVKQVTTTGTWKTYKTSHSPSGKGLTSTKKKSTAKATVLGHGLALTFDRSAKAGKVKVTVDGKSKTVDLYSSAGKPVTSSWTFSGPLKSHVVVVTVLGTKDKASKGTGVFLAALKVKS